jgi:hypothetical protein
MNIRTVMACVLLIALALYTAGRAMEEQQEQAIESSQSALNQTSWTTSDYLELDAYDQLLVYREDTPVEIPDSWYEPAGGESECCPAVPPMGAPALCDTTVQELPEMVI